MKNFCLENCILLFLNMLEADARNFKIDDKSHEITTLSMYTNIFSVVQAEARAEFAERSVQKLQKEVDRLEGAYSTFRSTRFSLGFVETRSHNFLQLFKFLSVMNID